MALPVLLGYGASGPVPGAAVAPESSMRSIQDVIFEQHLTCAQAAALVSAYVENKLLPAISEALPPAPQAHFLVEELILAIAWTCNPRMLDPLTGLLSRMERAGIATDHEWSDFCHMVFLCRQQQRQKSVPARLDGALPAFPSFVFPAGFRKELPSLIHLRGNIAGVSPFRIPEAGHLIAVVGSACHFSENALAAIAANKTIKTAISQHASFVMPPDFRFNRNGIEHWQLRHPEYQPGVLYDWRGWTGIVDFWESPVFHFCRHGKVQSTLFGWPDDGQMSKVKLELGKIGLI